MVLENLFGRDVADVLTVESVDMCMLDNGQQHHTSKFTVMTQKKDPRLVVRRGQSFHIVIAFNRPYNAETDTVSFVFTLASSTTPKHGNGSLVAIPLSTSSSTVASDWVAVYESHNNKNMIVNVTTSAKSSIGQWKLEIDTKIGTFRTAMLSYSHPSVFYVLLNPWIPEDEVYIADETHLNEYVLMDSGLIWRGACNSFDSYAWNYGQYEENILDCALYIMEKIGKVVENERGNPIMISRALSAGVNSNDDRGVLVGRWQGPYEEGVPPTAWTGSIKILQQYYEKKNSVKFGQCWVYAGILATVCRAIGLPCRVVTNFVSAHENEGSLTIDYYVKDDGSIQENESIWNFHVWNEAWMKRLDIGDAYSGWQVIDATPQERSQGVFCCGPASVKAIKGGEIKLPYDVPFILAEVNADKVYWKDCGSNKPIKLLRNDTTSVGQYISTKAVGKWEREDLTESYKFKEGSKEERSTMLKALKMCTEPIARFYLNEEFNDIKFDFILRDDITIGEPFDVVLKISNESKENKYTVKGKLFVKTAAHNGKLGKNVKILDINQAVDITTDYEIKMDVTFDEYYKNLVDHCAFNIACMVSVEETEYEYFAQDDFRVRKPNIIITVEGLPTVGNELIAHMDLVNPLPIALQKCKFIVEGCHILKEQHIMLDKDVAPGESATASVSFVPKQTGSHTLVVKFESNELDDVDGHVIIKI